MDVLVSYRLDQGVATLTMDDGKVNALSPVMLSQLATAFGRAEEQAAAVVLAGRQGVFSAGFDLSVLRGGGSDLLPMLVAGFRLAERLLAFPRPVVIACSGHAIAMGLFLVQSADYRVGVDGAFRLTANEVAIGLTMPWAAMEICRHRLTPAAFHRAMVLADTFTPREGVDAGLLDRVVPPTELEDCAKEVAGRLALLPAEAHAATKARARQAMLQALRSAVDAEYGPDRA